MTINRSPLGIHSKLTKHLCSFCFVVFSLPMISLMMLNAKPMWPIRNGKLSYGLFSFRLRRYLVFGIWYFNVLLTMLMSKCNLFTSISTRSLFLSPDINVRCTYYLPQIYCDATKCRLDFSSYAMFQWNEWTNSLIPNLNGGRLVSFATIFFVHLVSLHFH